ncbi:MAG: ATP phosphoribosyltransferase [Gemmatimonadetes bacterium]|nr:ATP phosphoribosyltransferase [Gemmatimonadota bacterium]
MLKIALPNKGRLADDVRALLDDAGLSVRVQSDRALIAKLGDEYEAIFVRSQDIPEFVADGAALVGITGWDLVTESERALVDRLDLNFGRCRILHDGQTTVTEFKQAMAAAGIPTRRTW